MGKKSENIEEVSYTKRNLKSIWLREPATRLRLKHITSDDSKKPLVRNKLLIEKWNDIYYRDKPARPAIPAAAFMMGGDMPFHAAAPVEHIHERSSNADITWLQGPFNADISLHDFQLWWLHKKDNVNDLKIKADKYGKWHKYITNPVTTNYQGPADINELRSRTPDRNLLLEKRWAGNAWWVINIKNADWSKTEEMFSKDAADARREEMMKNGVEKAKKNFR